MVIQNHNKQVLTLTVTFSLVFWFGLVQLNCLEDDTLFSIEKTFGLLCEYQKNASMREEH